MRSMYAIFALILLFATERPLSILPTSRAVQWNHAMSWIALTNGVLVCLARPRAQKVHAAVICRARAAPRDPLIWFWRNVHASRTTLASLYVLACAVRAMWPRLDESRACFYDSVLSTVLVGRSLATVGELCFCAQVCAAVLCANRDIWTATAILTANAFAQACCWYAVITRDQVGHVIEETIWLCTGCAWTRAFWHMDYNKFGTPCARKFRRFGLTLGPLYVLFMVLVDVPMYVERAWSAAHSGRPRLTMWHGFSEIVACQSVTQQDNAWHADMPWMTLYFSVAAWASIWLAHANVRGAGLLR